MNSGIIQPKQHDIFSNVFYEVLRNDFPQLLTDTATLVIPSNMVGISKALYSSKKFAESHVLVSAHVPNLYCTVRGNPVEQRGDRLITTGVDNNRNVSTIQKTESFYDVGKLFKVFIVDRPLMSEARTEEAGENEKRSKTIVSGGGPSEYLSSVPLIEEDFFEKISKIRKTYILVPGFETHLAQKIKDVSNMASSQISRYLQPSPPIESIQADVERAAYVTLHAWIYPHFSSLVKSALPESMDIEKILREMQAPESVLGSLSSIVPSIESDIVPLFSKLAVAVTPQQKINYLIKIFEKFHLRSSGGAEELLALVAVAIIVSGYKKGAQDVAYMQMYLSVHEDLQNQKPGFVITTFSSCVEFLSKIVVL